MPTKIIKAEPTSNAGVVIADSATRMHGNKDNYIQADEKGVTINGPMSIPSGSGQMRFSALWVMNNELALSLPSTIATPTPVMTINPPIAQLTSIMTDAMSMMALFGMLSAIG